MIFNFFLETDYKQFYIRDKSSPANTDSDSFWTNEANLQRLAMEDGILGIATESYSKINGEVEVLPEKNNAFDSNLYDHNVEGGLQLKTGELIVVGCLEFETKLTINLVPGKYRLRVYSQNLEAL